MQAAFIKVEKGNAPAFQEWLQAPRYVTVRTHRRYAANKNHMVVPAEALAADPAGITPRKL
jgi:hypothetical protein